jgi:hypothetical protein
MSRLNHHVVGSGMRKNLHDEGNYKKEGNFFCALCAIFFSKRKNCQGLYAEWVATGPSTAYMLSGCLRDHVAAFVLV